jgi:hypothetical protein
MKYLLILRGDAVLHLRRDEFERAARESGELVGGEVLADPQQAVTIPPGPARDIDGYYLVDVETSDRAVELARLLPDTRTAGRSVEIRAVMRPAAADF